MKNKLFVSNLDFEVTVEQLKQMFVEVGEVVSAVIATERESGRSKGFAFIQMGSDEEGEKSIEALNNRVVNGRPMKVVEDRGKGGGAPMGAGMGRGDGDGGEHRKREYLPPIQRMQLFRRRKKLDPFMEDPSKTIDYRDTGILSKFLSERGKILSRRLTGLNAYNQRKASKAIKRAQSLGLLPYSTVDQ